MLSKDTICVTVIASEYGNLREVNVDRQDLKLPYYH